MADTYQGDGYDAILTDHFLARLAQNRGGFVGGFKIPYDKIYKAVKHYPGRKCRALLGNQYWIHVVYEPAQNAVVFMSLLPKWYILPEPSIWVALI